MQVYSIGPEDDQARIILPGGFGCDVVDASCHRSERDCEDHEGRAQRGRAKKAGKQRKSFEGDAGQGSGRVGQGAGGGQEG